MYIVHFHGNDEFLSHFSSHSVGRILFFKLCHAKWKVAKVSFTHAAIPSKNAVSANIKHSIYLIKHSISGQSTTVVKGCMYMFDMVDTTFSYRRPLIVC